jgi:hypothetical protein
MSLQMEQVMLLYGEYLAKLAQRKPWQQDPMVEKIRQQVNAEYDVELENRKFYVYIISDPRPGKNLCKRYVGKGHGNRAYDMNGRSNNRRFVRFVAQCKKQNLDLPREIIPCQSEMGAFKLEMELIAKYGRLDLKTGTLYNLTNGGDGASGYKVTAKNRAAMRAAAKALWANPERSVIRRTALSATAKALWADPDKSAAQAKILATLKAQKNNPKRKAAAAAGFKSALADPEKGPIIRTAISAGVKKQWADPKQRKLKIAGIAAARPALKAATKVRWTDPQYRSAMVEMVKTNWRDPKYRAAMDPLLQTLQMDPKRRAIARKNLTEEWADPEKRKLRRNAVKAGLQTMLANPKKRIARSTAISAAAKAQWADPEKRATIIAAIREAHRKKAAKRNAAV